MVMTNLHQRIISGIVMTAIAIGCIIVGGQFFFMLLAILCIACLYEVWQMRLRPPALKWGAMMYILAGFSAAYYYHEMAVTVHFLLIALTVILTDVGAYFTGRILGGPKLAPRISPHKTWAGALGGLYFSTIIVIGITFIPYFTPLCQYRFFLLVLATSIAAQAGDLFESWLKRRAGVKDSSNYIPGHGGFFDRLDGWIAAFLVAGIVQALII